MRWAIGSYFTIHPPESEPGQFDLQKGDNLISAAMEALARPANPTAEEMLDTAHYTRQRGYDFSIGGR